MKTHTTQTVDLDASEVQAICKSHLRDFVALRLPFIYSASEKGLIVLTHSHHVAFSVKQFGQFSSAHIDSLSKSDKDALFACAKRLHDALQDARRAKNAKSANA